jgi:RimJ/RimL family protein N-acetyltransferase
MTNGFAFETPRLSLRRLDEGDAGFMCALLNDEAFLRYIGDRGVRTPGEAARYITDGPVASYDRHGFGLYLVALRDSGEPIGICGPLRRDSLPDADLGFALLPQFRSQGYALEAAAAVVAHARDTLGLPRLLAIASQDNVASIALLSKLGFRFEGPARLSDGEPELNLYALELRTATLATSETDERTPPVVPGRALARQE